MSISARCLVTALVLTLAFTGAGRGEVRTVDGDTIVLDGVRVRLFGIDAPERGQPGAREATDNLRRLIGSKRVECMPVDYDKRNERPVSLCSVEGRDLSLAQVRGGHAVVWCSFVRKLRPELMAPFQEAEALAKQRRREIWAREFRPWREWGC